MIALSDGNLVVEVYEAGAYVAAVYDITGVEWVIKGDPSRPTKAGMAFLAPYANRVRGLPTSSRASGMSCQGTARDTPSMGSS